MLIGRGRSFEVSRSSTPRSYFDRRRRTNLFVVSSGETARRGGALSFFGRSASSTASGGKEKEGVKEEESEESKVNSQMQLDVLALEEEAKDVLRVEVQEVEEWAVLRRTVGLS